MSVAIEGFEAVSMRRIAGELRAGTMTLYHYVRDKDELLSLMDDAVMGEVLVPDDELSADWREALTAIAVRTRTTFARHPWALEGLRGAEGGPNGVRHFEQSLAAVAGTGLDNRGKLDLTGLVDEYVIGFVTREVAQRAGLPAEGVEELLEQLPDSMLAWFESLLRTGDFPHIAALAGGGGARETVAVLASVVGDEERFERGLATLLDGVAGRLPHA